MSDSNSPQLLLNLEYLRKLAKQTLKRLRAGDSELLAAVRSQLPQLQGTTADELIAKVRLADIQQGLAIQHGYASWAELKRAVAMQEPLEQKAVRFLALSIDGEPEELQEILADDPELASVNVWCAAAATNGAAIATMISAEPELVTASVPGGQRTPLMYVAATKLQQGSELYQIRATALAGMLLDAGADANSFVLYDDTNPDSKLPALYYACINNNVPLVELLLRRGADPNDGESLYHAAELNHVACLELLLEHGADLSSRHPRWNNTPLYFLAGYFEGHDNQASCELGLRWMLEHGADPNVTSYVSGETPLHRIASFGHGPRVAELLLEFGAQVDAPRGDGRTPYVLALRSGNRAMMDYLASRGADVNLPGPADLLLGAAMSGNAAAVKQMQAANPGLMESLGDEEKRAIVDAAWQGKLPAVRLLAEAGFDVGFSSKDSGTALHAAAWHGNVDMVRELIALGAPVNLRDNTYGSSPIAWAAHGSVNCRKGADEDYIAVIRLLLDAGAERAPSFNNWNEAPESLGSKAVNAYLRESGFTR